MPRPTGLRSSLPPQARVSAKTLSSVSSHVRAESECTLSDKIRV